MLEDVKNQISELFDGQDLDGVVETLNELRDHIHQYSPFATEPVDSVRWVKSDSVYANNYNPNVVAPPEMELLRLSIQNDGYTQPIVTMDDGDGSREVIDGFHRNRVGKEDPQIQARIKGYLPVVTIRKEQEGRNDRIASTIRHNRARGKHRVDVMSDIVLELKRRTWSDERVAKELGMDPDEVLRLCQISGMAEAFSDEEFSDSWDIEGAEVLEPEEDFGDEDIKGRRQGGNGNIARIYHTWDQWESFDAGFFNTAAPEGLTSEGCKEIVANTLRDIPELERILEKVWEEWPKAVDHNMSNIRMNRLAWIEQAAACYEHGVPSAFYDGYYYLTPEERDAADQVALNFLNRWLEDHEYETIPDLSGAERTTQPELY